MFGQKVPSGVDLSEVWIKILDEVQKSYLYSDHLNYNIAKGYYGSCEAKNKWHGPALMFIYWGVLFVQRGEFVLEFIAL